MARFLIEVPHEAEVVACARHILPPAFRSQARIVGLNKFTMEQIDEILVHHQPKQTRENAA